MQFNLYFAASQFIAEGFWKVLMKDLISMVCESNVEISLQIKLNGLSNNPKQSMKSFPKRLILLLEVSKILTILDFDSNLMQH
jgi:hypothetical protein